MRSVFNMDGPIFEALSKLADMMILNVLFLVCCIPVITIGASLTAMSYVTLKMKDGTEGYIWRSFFKSFKENFKQSTLIWLILLVVGAALGFDVLLLHQLVENGGSSWRIMQYLVFLGLLIWVVVVLYVFPIQARFYNSIGNTLRNALLIAAANAPRVFLMLGAIAAAIIVTFLNNMTFVWGIFLWMVIGFSALSYLNSTLQIRIFRKLAGTEGGEEEMRNPDDWQVPEEDSSRPDTRQVAEEDSSRPDTWQVVEEDSSVSEQKLVFQEESTDRGTEK